MDTTALMSFGRSQILVILFPNNLLDSQNCFTMDVLVLLYFSSLFWSRFDCFEIIENVFLNQKSHPFGRENFASSASLLGNCSR